MPNGFKYACTLSNVHAHTKLMIYVIADDYKEAISTACSYSGKNVDSKQLISDP